jgi:hypothetical protein
MFALIVFSFVTFLVGVLAGALIERHMAAREGGTP